MYCMPKDITEILFLSQVILPSVKLHYRRKEVMFATGGSNNLLDFSIAKFKKEVCRSPPAQNHRSPSFLSRRNKNEKKCFIVHIYVDKKQAQKKPPQKCNYHWTLKNQSNPLAFHMENTLLSYFIFFFSPVKTDGFWFQSFKK